MRPAALIPRPVFVLAFIVILCGGGPSFAAEEGPGPTDRYRKGLADRKTVV